MGIRKFQVELDNPNRSFFPGQSVTGRIVVISKSNKKIELLTVKFFGTASVSWSEKITETKGTGSKKRESRKSVNFKNEEIYFNTEISLLGTHFDRISSERRDFPFSFELPPGLPSSYVGKAGQVYYYLEAKLKKSGIRNKTLENKMLFTVNGILDLNLEPGCSQGLELRKYKSLCCFCCQSGPVGFVLHLPRRGYVSGEILRFVIELSNQSNKRVKGVSLSLIQNVMFHAKGNTMEDMRVIRKVRGPIVNRGETENWEGDIFQVPPIPPTRLANCSIIDVQYLLQVEMQITGISTNLRGEVPITVGTIPLRNTFQELMARNQAIMMSYSESAGPSRTEMEAHVPSAPGFEGYPDLPPPSYAESMEGRQRIPLQGGIPNKSYSSASPSKTARSDDVDGTELSDQIGNNTDEDLIRAFVPNYVTYGWTTESGATFQRDNTST